MLKMAVNRAKQEREIPRSFIDECVEAKTKQCKKIKTTDKDIYPVEITQVEKARNMLKIHFKGYSEISDEWRPCNENNLPVMRLEPVSQRHQVVFTFVRGDGNRCGLKNMVHH